MIISRGGFLPPSSGTVCPGGMVNDEIDSRTKGSKVTRGGGGRDPPSSLSKFFLNPGIDRVKQNQTEFPIHLTSKQNHFLEMFY